MDQTRSRMATERVALKSRVMVVADTGWEEGAFTTLATNSVDAALKARPVEISLRLPKGAEWPKAGEIVELRFERLADFSPDGIVSQMPRLKTWVEARQLLESSRKGDSDPEEVVSLLSKSLGLPSLGETLSGGPSGKAPLNLAHASGSAQYEESATKEAAAEGRLDELLAGVALATGDSEGATAPAEVRIAEAAAGWASDPGPAAGMQRLEAGIQVLDEAISKAIRTILEMPELRKIEQTWRGLAMLARQARGSGVSVEVLASSRENFLETFFEEAFHREYRREDQDPLIMVLCPYEFENSAEDLEDLETAARFGESLSVPFLAQLKAEFWGVERPALLAGLPDLRERLQRPEYIKWRAFKEEERSSWLFLAANRYLGRGTWGEDGGGRIRSFTFSAEACRPLWMGTSWLLAAMACQAIRVAGAKLRLQDTVFEDLPLNQQTPRRGAPFAYPLEILLQDHRVEELGWLGITAPISNKGSDQVEFQIVPSWHKPAIYDSDSATRASERAATLPQRIYAALVTHRFERIAASLDTPGDVSAWRERLLSDLEPFYTVDDSDLGEQVTVEMEDGLLLLRLRPSFDVGTGPLDMVLSVGLEN